MKPFLAALIPSVVLMLIGSLTGLLVGQSKPWMGALTGVTVVCLGVPWSVRRMGSPGFGAAALGMLGACAFAIEGRHATVAFADVEALASFSEWNIERTHAVTVPLVRPQGAWAAQFQTVQRTKFSTRTIRRIATPLIDQSGRVVAVTCRRPTEPLLDQGTVFVALERFEGEVPDGCREAVSAAKQRVEQAGGVVDPAAFERVVRVYANGAALREDQQLASVTWVAAAGPLMLACWSTWRGRARPVNEQRT